MWNSTMWNTTRLTVELGELVDSGVDIWDFEYDSFYKGDAKKEFEQKVIDHYRFRQIGSETVGRFLHQFKTKVREIMPKYVRMYKVQTHMDAIEDPFESYNLIEEYTAKSTDTSNSSKEYNSDVSESHSGSDTQSNVMKHSDTPQGSIANIDSYMSDATKGDSSGESSSEMQHASTSTEDVTDSKENNTTYTINRHGNIGVQPLGYEFKTIIDSIINIDMMIIDELNELFLGVY